MNAFTLTNFLFEQGCTYIRSLFLFFSSRNWKTWNIWRFYRFKKKTETTSAPQKPTEGNSNWQRELSAGDAFEEGFAFSSLYPLVQPACNLV